jgi:hypothetical protein
VYHIAQKNKKPPPTIKARSSYDRQILQLNNVLGLRAAVALNYVELNALAFVQSLEAFANDSAEVNEYIVAAFNFDETEALFCVEPFNCTCLHGITSKKFVQYGLLIPKNKKSAQI